MLGLESVYELSTELFLPFCSVLFFRDVHALDILEPTHPETPPRPARMISRTSLKKHMQGVCTVDIAVECLRVTGLFKQA